MRHHEQKIKAMLGTWGFQTSGLGHDDLVYLGRTAFNVPGRSLGDVAVAISRLDKHERAARVKEAVRTHWPDPMPFLPKSAPIRRMLALEPH